MLDRERVLAKIDALDGYLRELHEILPASFEEYQRIEKRRACERLLQVSIECVIDLCGLKEGNTKKDERLPEYPCS